MRDLHAALSKRRPPVSEAVDLGPEDPPPADDFNPDLDRQIRKVKVERKASSVALMLLDVKEMIEPVVELLCDRALRWAALLGLIGLTAYELAHPSWERMAAVAVFAALAPWVIKPRR